METQNFDMSHLGNRKNRRAMAKYLGLLKDKNSLPLKERIELQRRSIAAGKVIHSYHTQNMENAKIEYQQELESKKYEEELDREETTNNTSKES